MAPSFSLVWVHSNGLNWKMQVPSGRTNPALATSRPDCFPVAFLSSSMNESLAVIPQIFHRAGRFHPAVHAGCRLNIHIIHQPPQAAAQHGAGRRLLAGQAMAERLPAHRPGGRLARRVVDQRRQRIAGLSLRFFRHGVFIPVQMLFHISRLLATACPKQAFAIRQKNVSDYRLFFQNLKFHQKIS